MLLFVFARRNEWLGDISSTSTVCIVTGMELNKFIKNRSSISMSSGVKSQSCEGHRGVCETHSFIVGSV